MGRLKKEDQIKVNKLLETTSNNDFKTFKKIGDIYYRAAFLRKSICFYKKAIELNPSDASLFDHLGNIYEEIKNFDEAIKCHTKAIELNPSDAVSYYNLAHTYQVLNDLKSAINCYKKAIDLDPSDEGTYNNLGITYKNLKIFDEAINCYKKAIELNPSYASAYFNLGNTYKDLKKFDEAISYYKKAIELDPFDTDPYFNLGNTYNNLKKFDEAINCYKKIIELNPSDEDTYNNLGITYKNLENYDQAIKCYKKAIELNKNCDAPYRNLGVVYWFEYDYHKALAYYKKAYDLNKAGQYCFYIGKFLDINPDNSIFNKISIEFIKEAMEKDYYNAFVYYSSYYYDNKISIDDAIKTLELCIKKFHDNENLVDVYFELGKLYSESCVLNKELALNYFELASKEGYDCTYEILKLDDNNKNTYKEIINNVNKEDIFNSNKMYQICEYIIGESFAKLQDNSKSFINRAIRAYILETLSDNEEEDYSSSLVYLGKALELELNLYLGDEVKKYIEDNELDSLEIGQMMVNSNSFKTINQVIYPYKKKKDHRILDKVLVDSLLNNVFKENIFGNVNEEINLSNYLFNFYKEINNFTDKRNTAAHKGHINQQQCEKWFDKMIGSGRMLQNFLAKLR